MAGKKVFLGLTLGLMLSGCIAVPGSNIKLGGQMPPDNAAVNLSNQLNVQAITPDLVAHLRSATPSPDANPDLDKAVNRYEYLVGAGDVLSIVVWDHPELTNPAIGIRAPQDATAGQGMSGGMLSRPSSSNASATGVPGTAIDVDGTIYFPYIGVIKVGGLKLKEIRTLLRERLSHYFTDPQIDVSVLSFRAQKIYVTGEVKQPGTLPLTNIPLTLLDAVNLSGGVLPSADWGNVILTRQGQDIHFSLRDLYQHGDTRQNTLLLPNDLVFVPRTDSNKVFVLGEVKKTQSVLMTPNGLTLADALTESGGINELSANASGIFVLRRNKVPNSDKLIDVFQLNAQDATALILADAFPLHERDIVYVTAAPVSRWNRIISQLLPSLDLLYLSGQTKATGL